ncbi:MAG: RhuM family protein [Fibrobacter sp.]|nr:RhuM family protein [Fibrobacter sp.]
MAADKKQDTGNSGEIIIYQTEDGNTKVDVRFVDETVWLTQAQLVDLYQSSKANVSEHIKHIFEEGELDEVATVRNFRTVQLEGTREVSREQVYYNLDMIISLGYRVKSMIATKFRRWATERLKEYIIKVQAMRHNVMHMSDYVEHLDKVLKTTGEKLLTGLKALEAETDGMGVEIVGGQEE